MKKIYLFLCACVLSMATAFAQQMLVQSNMTVTAGNFSSSGYLVQRSASGVTLTLDSVGNVTTVGDCSPIKLDPGVVCTVRFKGRNYLKPAEQMSSGGHHPGRTLDIVTITQIHRAGIDVPKGSTLVLVGDDGALLDVAGSGNAASIGGSSTGEGRGADGAKGANGYVVGDENAPKKGGDGSSGTNGQDAGHIIIKSGRVNTERIGGGDGADGGHGGRGGHGSVDSKTGSDCSVACHSGAPGGNGGDGGTGGAGGMLTVEGGELTVVDIRGGNGGIGGTGGVGGTKSCTIEISPALAIVLTQIVSMVLQVVSSVISFALQFVPLPGVGVVAGTALQIGVSIGLNFLQTSGGIPAYKMVHGSGGKGGNSIGGAAPTVIINGGSVLVSGDIQTGRGRPGSAPAFNKDYAFDFGTTCWAGKKSYYWGGTDVKDFGEAGSASNGSVNDATINISNTSDVTIAGSTYAVLGYANCEKEFVRRNTVTSTFGRNTFNQSGYAFSSPGGTCDTVRITLNDIGVLDSMEAGMVFTGNAMYLLKIKGHNEFNIRDGAGAGIGVSKDATLIIDGGEGDTLIVNRTDGRAAIGGMRQYYLGGVDDKEAGGIEIRGGTIIASRVGGGDGANGKWGGFAYPKDSGKCATDMLRADSGRAGGNAGKLKYLNIYGGSLHTQYLGGGRGGRGGDGGALGDLCLTANNYAGTGGRGGNGGNGGIINVFGGTLIADTIGGGNGGEGGAGGMSVPIDERAYNIGDGSMVIASESFSGDGGSGGNGGTPPVINILSGTLLTKVIRSGNGGDGGEGTVGADALSSASNTKDYVVFKKLSALEAGNGGKGGSGGNAGDAGNGSLTVYGGRVNISSKIMSGNGGRGGNGGDGGDMVAEPEDMIRQHTRAAADAITWGITVAATAVGFAMAYGGVNMAFNIVGTALGSGALMHPVGMIMNLATQSLFFGLQLASTAVSEIHNHGKDGAGGAGGAGGVGGNSIIKLNIYGGNVDITSNLSGGAGGAKGIGGIGGGGDGHGVNRDKRVANGTDGAGGNTGTANIVIEGGSVLLSSALDTLPKDNRGYRVYKNTYTVTGYPNTLVWDGSVAEQLMSWHKLVWPAGYGINDVYSDAAAKLYFWLPATASRSERVEIIMAKCGTFEQTYPRPAINMPVDLIGPMGRSITVHFQKGDNKCAANPVPASITAGCDSVITLPAYNSCITGHHPYWVSLPRGEYNKFLQTIIGSGSSNSNVYYPNTTLPMVPEYRKMLSGGVWYHPLQQLSTLMDMDTLRVICVPDTSMIQFNHNNDCTLQCHGQHNDLMAVYGYPTPQLQKYLDDGILYDYIPRKFGHTFTGYYDSIVAGKMYYNNKGVVTVSPWDKVTNLADNDSVRYRGRYTMYAHWVPDTTVLRFMGNGGVGDGLVKNVKAPYGEMLPSMTAPLHTRTGYTLMGYSNVQNCSDAQCLYYDAEGVALKYWYDTAKNADLYAQWVKNKYRVHYDVRGGNSAAPADVTVDFDAEIIVSGYTGTRSGYLFANWSLDSNAVAGEYSEGDILKGLTSVNGATVTLYAAWTPARSRVNFENNTLANATVTGGQTASLIAIYNSDMPTLTQSVPSTSNAKFAGYWDAMDGGIMYYDANGAGARVWDKPQSPVTLYAHWTNATYNVVYRVLSGSGGAVPPRINGVGVGAGITMPNYYNEQYIGYTFAGWSTEPYHTTDDNILYYPVGSKAYNLTFDNGVTVYLFDVWEPIKGSACYGSDCGGPTGPSNASALNSARLSRASAADGAVGFRFNIVYGQSVGDVTHNVKPDVKEGYTFEGYFASNGVMYFDADARPVQQYWLDTDPVVRFYSHWTANKYNVVYNKNGGNGDAPMTHTAVKYDSAIVLQPYTGSKYGYVFAGWSLSADGAEPLAAGSTVINLAATDGATVTLYAVWQPTVSVIAFNPNGGEGGQGGTVTAQYASAMPLLNAAPISLRGYKFEGYADNEGTLYYNSTFGSADTWNKADGNYTLKAKWTASRYNIEYNVQGGTLTAPAAHTGVRYDENVVLREYTGVKTGYIFEGWATAPKATTKTYDAGTTVQGIGEVDGSTVTLYAAWKPQTTTMRYDANGGSFPIELDRAVIAEYGAPMPSFVIYPSRMAQDFAGFYDAPTGGVMYYNANGSSIRNWDKLDVETAVMYARWQVRPLELRFNANGGIGEPTGVYTVYYGGELPTLGTMPARIGYTFLGFYDDEDVLYYDSTGVRRTTWDKLSPKTTLYAHWRVKTTILDFDMNGGESDSESEAPMTMVAEYGARVPELDVNVRYNRAGYMFYGFYDAPVDGTMYYNMFRMSANFWDKDMERKTLYAQWLGLEYTLEYKNIPMGLIEALPEKYQTGVGLDLPVARHNQYTFGGYYADSAMTGAAVTHMSPTDTGRRVLYLKWTYTVEYNTNGGTGSALASEVQVYNGAGSISAVPADWERGGYECVGWSTDVNATEALIPREGGVAQRLPINKTVRLYAVWRAATTKIILSSGNNVGGGFAASDPEIAAQYGSAMPTLAGVPVREGSVFAGYYDSPEGGTQYYTSGGTSVRTWDKIAKTVTLYARWVTEKADNLRGMQVNIGNLQPAFSANVREYGLALPCGEAVTLLLDYAHGNTVKVNGTQVQTSYVIAAGTTDEVLHIEVAEAGKASVIYTVKLNVPLSSDHILYYPEASIPRMEVSDARYDSYQWYEDGVALADATSEVLYLAGVKAGSVYSVTAYADGDSVRICGQTVSAVSGGKDEKALVASPNPATTHITVSHPDLGKESTVVKVYSAGGGSLVLSQIVEAGSRNAVQIDISMLAAGSYVIEVFGTTKMIVKQ